MPPFPPSKSPQEPEITEEMLLALLPEDIRDPVGAEIERVQGSQVHTWKAVALLTTALFSASTIGLIVVAIKASHPRIIWMRTDATGNTQAIPYTDLSYTPMTVDVRRYLTNWAQDSYSRRPETVLQTYRRRFYFMSSPLVAETRNKDDQAQLIPNIRSGRLPGNTISGLDVSFTSFVSKGSRAKGTAQITYTTVPLQPSADNPPQHCETTITFEVDPSRVPSVTQNLLPEYQQVNPIGLLITFMDERTQP